MGATPFLFCILLSGSLPFCAQANLLIGGASPGLGERGQCEARPGVRQRARFVWGWVGEPRLVLGELRVSSRRRQPALPALVELGWPSVPSPFGLLLQGNGGTPDKHLPAPVPKHKKKASDGSDKARVHLCSGSPTTELPWTTASRAGSGGMGEFSKKGNLWAEKSIRNVSLLHQAVSIWEP